MRRHRSAAAPEIVMTAHLARVLVRFSFGTSHYFLQMTLLTFSVSIITATVFVF